MKRSKQMPMPSKKKPKLTDEVLLRIAGGETLAALGRELNFHPTSWGDWIAADEHLAVAYQRARDTGGDALAEEALALIDAEPTRVEGRVDPGHVQWTRARVDTRLKLLACWNPKKYGTKQTVDVGNKDGEALKVETNVGELAATLAASLRAAKSST
jgi:hypothetical protein